MGVMGDSKIGKQVPLERFGKDPICCIYGFTHLCIYACMHRIFRYHDASQRIVSSVSVCKVSKAISWEDPEIVHPPEGK